MSIQYSLLIFDCLNSIWSFQKYSCKTFLWHVYTECIQPCNMKKETFIEEDTRNIVYRTMTPQSPSKYKTWDLTELSPLPSTALWWFPESHQRSEISSLSKVIWVLGKARSTEHHSWAVKGLSHLDDLMFCQKTLHKTWCMSRSIAVIKLRITNCPELRPSESSE